MNIFQKLTLISKLQKGYKAVNTVLKDKKTIAEFNELKAYIDKIKDGLTGIKNLVPEAKDGIEVILNELF